MADDDNEIQRRVVMKALELFYPSGAVPIIEDDEEILKLIVMAHANDKNKFVGYSSVTGRFYSIDLTQVAMMVIDSIGGAEKDSNFKKDDDDDPANPEGNIWEQ